MVVVSYRQSMYPFVVPPGNFIAAAHKERVKLNNSYHSYNNKTQRKFYCSTQVY